MKTTLLSLFTAAILGLAVSAHGQLFDPSEFVAVAFATVLVAWTFAQYNAAPRALNKARPIHLPIKGIESPMGTFSSRRRAA